MSAASAWRMMRKCSNCPFAKKGDGKRLRESLRPGRMREITEGLRKGAAR